MISKALQGVLMLGASILLVQKIGGELRGLLAQVDDLMPQLPEDSQKPVRSNLLKV